MFNVSELEKKTVKKATLKLVWSFRPTIKNVWYGTHTKTHSYGFYDAGVSWSEDGITWDSPWAKSGAIGEKENEDSPLVEATPDNPTEGSTFEIDLTGLVSDWVSGDLANNGIVISAPTTDMGVYALFYTSESEEANRPKLVVDYDETSVLTAQKQKQGIVISGLQKAIRVEMPEQSVKSTISLFNLQGQKIDSQQMLGATTLLKMNVCSGVYLVSIQQGEALFSRKVVVQ